MKHVFLILLIVGCCSCTSKTSNNNTVKNNDTIKVISAPITYKIQSDSIRRYSKKLEMLYKEVYPSEIADKWYLPFDLSNRSDLKMINIISNYGTYRSSRVKGHKHSGIDIIPSNKNDTVNVYPLSKGVVCFVNTVAPNKTVIVKHKLKDGRFLFSAYIHLKEIFIKIGQEVNHYSKIGVLYTKNEALKFNGNYDHLHLEIKKRIDDYSCASWLCMSAEELDDYFFNPIDFLKLNLIRYK